MPHHLVGSPKEAAAQLISILKSKGALDEKGNLVDPEPRGPIDAFLKGESVFEREGARGAEGFKESSPS